MNEIGRHGRALLDDARRERTPDATARERVFAALLEDTAVTKLAKADAPPRPERKPLTPVGKCLLLLGLAAAVAAGVYAASHVGSRPPTAPPPAHAR
jgi:hypothetical protein